MHGIEEVIVMTLARSEKRQNLCRGALFARRVPDAIINMWEGNDSQDYENPVAVVQAAIADGFPHCRHNLERDWITAPITAQTWEFYRILRYVCDMDGLAMVIFDDSCLTSDFGKYNEVVSFLSQHDVSFKMLLLEYWLFEGEQWSYRYPREKQTPIDIIEAYPFIGKGILGAGDKLIISAAGAKWLLNQIEICADKQIEGDQRLEHIMFHLSQNERYTDGCYTMLIHHPASLRTVNFPYSIVGSFIHTEDFQLLGRKS